MYNIHSVFSLIFERYGSCKFSLLQKLRIDLNMVPSWPKRVGGGVSILSVPRVGHKLSPTHLQCWAMRTNNFSKKLISWTVGHHDDLRFVHLGSRRITSFREKQHCSDTVHALSTVSLQSAFPNTWALATDLRSTRRGQLVTIGCCTKFSLDILLVDLVNFHKVTRCDASERPTTSWTTFQRTATCLVLAQFSQITLPNNHLSPRFCNTQCQRNAISSNSNSRFTTCEKLSCQEVSSFRSFRCRLVNSSLVQHSNQSPTPRRIQRNDPVSPMQRHCK
jgi:hypothetical protein